jgi:type IV pilus assembly protein PilM
MPKSFGARPWVGLDVGSFSIKLLAIQGAVGGSRYWLAETPLPQTAVETDQVQTTDNIARAISECFSKANLSYHYCRGISLGIAGPDVIVKQISLPLLDDAEVGPALRFEARKHLPFDPQSMILDFQILARYASERRLEILLAAVSQQHAEQHLAPFKALGIEPHIVDATPLALVNGVHSDGNPETGATVILDIGNASSHLAIYSRGQPFFTRRLEFGGRDLTRAIAQGIRVPFQEAEEWKLAVGADEPGLRIDWESVEMQAVLDCLRTDLADELTRSFAFYRTMGQLPDSLRLWISGGSARLPGLASQLAELLDLPVQLYDPLASLEGPPRGGWRPTTGPQFAQAYGLATRTT